MGFGVETPKCVELWHCSVDVCGVLAHGLPFFAVQVLLHRDPLWGCGDRKPWGRMQGF